MFVIEKWNPNKSQFFGASVPEPEPLFYVPFVIAGKHVVSLALVETEGKIVLHGVFHDWNKTFRKILLEEFEGFLMALKRNFCWDVLYVYKAGTEQEKKTWLKFVTMLGFKGDFELDGFIFRYRRF